jgi:SAM-dependent methyltransferase
VRRLNWGCGLDVAEGWTNSDLNDHGQEHVGDVRDGLPWADGEFDYVVAHHALDMLTPDEVDLALLEFARVLVPGGVLRLSTPDVERGFAAAANEDVSWFGMVERGTTAGAKLCFWLTWWGTRRSLWTRDALLEQLLTNGFARVALCPFGSSRYAGPAIVELDRRGEESFFMEATT